MAWNDLNPFFLNLFCLVYTHTSFITIGKKAGVLRRG